jgi:hypothetical protein
VRFLRRLFGSASPPERDEDRFARRVVEALREVSPEIRVTYDPQAFELRHVDDASAGQRTFLYNSFAEYRRLAEEEQDAHIANFARFITESRKPQPSGEAALDMLLPLLRSRADVLAVCAQQEGEFAYTRASRQFCENMLIMLALDSEHAIRLVTDGDLDQLGVTFDDALGIAIAHLDEKGSHSFGQLAEGTFVTTCGDYYDASRVLIPEMFGQLPVNGNPVAIVQARSAVLVTGSEDMDGLAMIAGFALEDLADNERAVALNPIELVDGQWRPFAIAADHPQALKNLMPTQLAWAYNATKDAVQELLGDDIFVPTALLLQQDGKAATAATWAAGVPTAVPLVDAILIEEDGAFPKLCRSLEDVLKACGPFEEVAAFPHPRRWMLPGRMTAAQRTELTDNYPHHDFFAEQAP